MVDTATDHTDGQGRHLIWDMTHTVQLKKNV